MPSITIKERSNTWLGQAQISVRESTDDQFMILHITTLSHDIQLTLHNGTALEISGALEDQFQDNINRLEAALEEQLRLEATSLSPRPTLRFKEEPLAMFEE